MMYYYQEHIRAYMKQTSIKYNRLEGKAMVDIIPFKGLVYDLGLH